MKITEPDYYLPQIQALEFVRLMTTGANKPHLILGRCTNTAVKSEYVLKPKYGERMSPEACARELVAAFIAKEIDLPVADPAIITIEEDIYVKSLIGKDVYLSASKSVGYNFGTKYVSEYPELTQSKDISKGLEDKIKQLFFFDMMIQNSDRTIQKPNCLSNGKDLVFFDHELAFSFSKIIGFSNNDTSWDFTKGDTGWLKQNICYNILKGKQRDFSQCITNLEILNKDDFWGKIQKTLPTEWELEDLACIRKHISNVISNKVEFTSLLQNFLKVP